MSDLAPEPLPPDDLADTLATFHIFKDVPRDALTFLNARRLKRLRPGVTIFRQGDIIGRIFLVVRGEIELLHVDRHDRELRRVVRPGQVLGRLELDAAEGQLGAARTLTSAELIAIDISELVRLRAQFPELKSNFDRSDVIGHLRGNPYFAPLTDFEIKWISDILVVDRATPATILYREGDEASDVVILRQGRVRLQSQKKQRWVSAGSVIGFRAVLQHRVYGHTAEVVNQTRFFKLPAEDFLAVTARHPEHRWLDAPIPVTALLARARLFRTFSPKEIDLLAGFVMQVHYHTPHQIIVQADKHDQYYYILARGAALLKTTDANGQITSTTVIGRGADFGEASLLFGDPSDITVETIEPTDWIRIHRRDFALFLEESPQSKQHLTLPEALRQRQEKHIYLGDWQREDEEVLSIRRRHWIVLLQHLWPLLALMLLHLLIAGALRVMTSSWHLWLNLSIAAVYTLLLGGWFVLDYLNDFHIVTTYRVVHQEKVLYVKEQRISAPIDQIQDIGIERSFWGRILGYGHLVISTAAAEGQIVFDYHPKPNEAYHYITEELTRIKRIGASEQQQIIQKQLQERLNLGLEERIDDRALLDSVRPRKITKPKGKSFFSLLGLQEEPGNRIVWRRHWFGLILKTLPPFIAALIMLFLFGMSLISPFFRQLPLRSHIALSGVSFLLLMASLFWLWWRWEDWENDRFIVSDQLIEEIIQKPLWFDEERKTFSLERVQNVDFRRPNFLAFLLDFGDVHIQTAATEGMIKFDFVPAPDAVQYEILRRIQDYQENLEKRRQQEQKNDFIEWIEAYHKLVNHSQPHDQG